MFQRFTRTSMNLFFLAKKIQKYIDRRFWKSIAFVESHQTSQT